MHAQLVVRSPQPLTNRGIRQIRNCTKLLSTCDPPSFKAKPKEMTPGNNTLPSRPPFDQLLTNSSSPVRWNKWRPSIERTDPYYGSAVLSSRLGKKYRQSSP